MTTTGNMSLGLQNSHHPMTPGNNNIDNLLAASVDEQFKLIAKSSGSSKFPPAVAFEIAIAKPSIVQQKTPGQAKVFQRSSKVNQNAT